MKLFAHRGNLNGPNPADENKPEYLQKALDKGYCVEVDIWLGKDGLYSGHDNLSYPIRKEFLIDERVLVHAKTVQTFEYLLKFPNIHCFYQDKDFVSITSNGYRIYHNDCNSYLDDDKSIIVDIQLVGALDSHKKCYGVITDKAYEISKTSGTKEQKQKCFSLLVLDVDGVLTNGKKTYDKEHNVLSKEFCDRDFTAIKRFASAGIPTILLTGDRFNLGMADKRKLDFVDAREYSSQLDKAIAIEAISKSRNINVEDIAYVGDDYYDLSALNVVGHPYCPQNAAQIVKESATVIPRDGGDGVIEALFESLKDIRRSYPYEPTNSNR